MKSINQTELTVAPVKPQPVALAPETGISIQAAFQAVMNTDLNAEKLSVMKQLLAMNAEQQFNSAFVAMQSELPVIVAESVIPNRGKYQKYEDIMQKDGVAKILARHGFSVSFDQKNEAGVITVTCILRHAGGHSHPTSFAVRGGGRADSECQADCKASTTAKRNALCQALNITIRQDVLQDEENDASLLGSGEFITDAQADEIEHRIAMLAFTPVQVTSFLKWAGGESCKKYSQIPESKFEACDKFLSAKEKAQ